MKKKKQRRENTRRDVCSQGGSAIAHTHTHTYTQIYTHMHAHIYTCHVVKIIGARTNACIVHDTDIHTHTHSLTRRYTSPTNTKTIKQIRIYSWWVAIARGKRGNFDFEERDDEEKTVSMTRYNTQ